MKPRAPLNRTLVLSDSEKKDLSNQLTILQKKSTISEVKNKIINQDLVEVIDLLPDNFIDLLFIDPPYNLNKKFAAQTFKKMQTDKYEDWLDSWLLKLIPRLKKNASVYFCCDWKTSNSAYNVLRKYFIVRNRITWEREKGRGSKDNWKNSYEDIWYCTVTDSFTFNLNAVKLKRLVRAPYKNDKGTPKDWKSENGKNFRITHPSNLWTDITIPFWSMPENTDHPTQKPEKLLAKIILASSNRGDIIFDPFAGSGTAPVAAKKLDRSYCGVEIDKDFALLTVKRLSMAEKDKSIQGYHDGIFWERNTLSEQKKSTKG